MLQKISTGLVCCVVSLVSAGFAVGRAAELVVSANDGKHVRVGGAGTYPIGAPSDTLTVLDISSLRPRIVAEIDVKHTLLGPPQEVALTPDGRYAVVSAPNYYDHDAKAIVFENFLQIVDIAAKKVIDRVDVGSHPQGVAINRAGTLLLACTVSGEVVVLDIASGRFTVRDKLKISDRRLSGVSFTHDGTAAMIGLRDEQGLMVLDVNGSKVTTNRERIATGVSPYSVEVSSDGKWAVVNNAGLAGLANSGQLSADVDSFTLIDMSRRPFRAVQHVTVPATPEGVTISPDGRWIAAQSMNGSNLLTSNPARNTPGRVLLFENRNGVVKKTGDLPGGEAAQGIIFSADGQRLLVQFNVEKQIAVYANDAGRLRDTGIRVPLSAGPASIRSVPR